MAWIWFAGLIGCCLVICVIFLLTHIMLVPHNTAIVISRLGRIHRVIGAGLHFLVPYVDRTVRVTWTVPSVRNTPSTERRTFYKIPITTLKHDNPAFECTTRDNAKMTIDVIFYSRIVEPAKAINAYELWQTTEETVQVAIINIVKSHMFSDLIQSPDKYINTTTVCEAVAIQQYCTSNGIAITNIGLQSFLPSQERRETEEAIVKHQRTVEAELDILRAELEQSKARAKAEQDILRAKAAAEAEAIRVKDRAWVETQFALVEGVAKYSIPDKDKTELVKHMLWARAFSHYTTPPALFFGNSLTLPPRMNMAQLGGEFVAGNDANPSATQ